MGEDLLLGDKETKVLALVISPGSSKNGNAHEIFQEI
jgi:hypothetical protein